MMVCTHVSGEKEGQVTFLIICTYVSGEKRGAGDFFHDMNLLSSLCNGSSDSRKNSCDTSPISQNGSSFCNGSSSRAAKMRPILPIKPPITPVIHSRSRSNPATQHDWLTSSADFGKVSQGERGGQKLHCTVFTIRKTRPLPCFLLVRMTGLEPA